MELEIWLAFVAACGLMAIIPGPGLLNVVGYAVSSGRSTALTSVLGMACGDFVAVSLSMAGLGAILSASATAFEILKLAGAAYLIWLGVSTILKAERTPVTAQTKQPLIGKSKAFWGGFLIAGLHPKTIVFSVAFLPQFIDPSIAYLPQASLLVVTFCIVFACVMTFCALAASSAEPALKSATAQRWTGRIGGTVLVVSGLIAAGARRPT